MREGGCRGMVGVKAGGTSCIKGLERRKDED